MSCLSVCLSVRLSVCMEQLGYHWTDFHEILYLSIFRKFAQKNKISLQSDNNNGTLREDRYTILIIPHLVRLRVRNVSDECCRENPQTPFMLNKFFFRKLRHLWGKAEKYCRAKQASNDSMAHAHCVLDTCGCQHILKICITHCFSTTTMIARTRLSVTLYVNCLSGCSVYFSLYYAFTGCMYEWYRGCFPSSNEHATHLTNMRSMHC